LGRTPTEQEAAATEKTTCFHCGLDCADISIAVGEKYFCCRGCKAVFEFLNDSGLAAYYQDGESPGVKPESFEPGSRFAYLDSAEIRQRLVDFSDGTVSRITLSLPQIHCASCVWLLENLYRLRDGVRHSSVNFPRKELTVVFEDNKLSLRQLAELLTRMGFEPQFRLDSIDKQPAPSHKRSLYLKIGVAGFCFGNIMLLSIPQYLSLDIESSLTVLFRYTSVGLALPVLLYSAGGYFQSAYTGLRQKLITIDVPIALGMLALVIRSGYEIFSGLGPGYLDSFTGLAFFLLVGRLFQQKTYDHLSFDRDYRSYFPISVLRVTAQGETSVPIAELNVGDRIRVRNQELVPADGILLNGEGFLDYSFVTGESEPQHRADGEQVYAGGRQVGGAIELRVTKKASQSYLTRLWNSPLLQSQAQPHITDLANRVGKYFTAAVLVVAAGAALYWLPRDTHLALNAFTSVLIIACPCALALSSPFALGTALRLLGRKEFYLRTPATVEALAAVDTIVFDKTGTLTKSQDSEILFEGSPLTAYEMSLAVSLARQSTHPVSRRLAQLPHSTPKNEVHDFAEVAGRGITGQVDGHLVRLGRRDWASWTPGAENTSLSGADTASYLSIDKKMRGQFRFTNKYRDGVPAMVSGLRQNYHLALLSGDKDHEQERLRGFLGEDATLIFEQSPHDKLAYISRLQQENHRVLMVGDGLNDGGALRAADVGIAVSEDTAAFSPGCDGILRADGLAALPRYLRFARRSLTVVKVSFALSFVYNLVGLSFAVTGQLSPLISAVLMPASSISVVLFATTLTGLQARAAGVD
jgi:Cu+-exporting ATPase